MHAIYVKTKGVEGVTRPGGLVVGVAYDMD